MDAKTYLRQIAHKDAKINALIERKDRYRDLAERRTAVYRDTPGGSRAASNCEEYVCKIVDLEKEIDRRIDEYVDLTREIEAEIGGLGDSRYRDILRFRYINEWSWEKIAEAINYDRRQTTRLHGLALLEIEKRCPKMSQADVL